MKKKIILMDLGFNNAYIRKMLTVMRITVLFCLLGVLQVTASNTYSQEARISLNVKNAAVSDVLREIEEKSEFFFLYNNKLIDVDRLVDIEVKNKSITKVLDVLFDDSVDRKIDDKLIVLSSIGLKDQENNQDQFIRKGSVLSAEDGSGLPGVSVVIKGTTIGTSTDIGGNFSIKANEGDILIFSFMGMVPQEFTIVDNKPIEISLSPDALQVDEVMVVAYGTAKKESFTGSAEVVKSEDLIKTSSGTVSKALLGKVAGVQVSAHSAAAGDGADIRIRGIGSANASSAPLYVVDGVANAPIPNNNDIESLTILKDAAAASLYGSRAANGVVVITTKKGKGKTKVNVKYRQTLGQRSKSKFELMDANQYMAKAWEGLYNQERYIKGNESGAAQYAHDNLFSTVKYNPYVTNNNGENIAINQPFDNNGKLVKGAKLLYDTNWLDEVYRTGITHDAHVSLSRGSDRGSVYGSFAYFDQKGILIGNDYKKFNYTLNTSYKITEKLEFTINTNGRYYEGRENRSLWDVYTFSPVTPVYERAGITTDKYDDKYSYGDIMQDASGRNMYHWNKNYYNREKNPLAEVDNYEEGYDGMTIFVSPSLVYKPLDGLMFSAKGSAKFKTKNESYFYDSVHGAGVKDKGRGTKYHTNYRTLASTLMAVYEKDFGRHNIKATAVYEVEEFQKKYLGARGKDYPMWEINNELGAAQEKDFISSSTNELAMISYLGQLEYGFADKYYLSGSFRRDGSSRFGPEKRWGDFWSVGATWRLSEENFIKDISFINNLKLRGSYGVNGNDNLLDQDGNTLYYPWQSSYGLDGQYNGKKYAYLDQIGNKTLAWEGNINSNIALEFKLFQKLWGTIEYYQRESDRLLLFKKVPSSSGADSRMENVGRIKNSGLELSIGSILIDNDSFKWNVNFTYTQNENEILEWYGDNWSGSGQTFREEGGSMYNLRMKKWAGVDSQTGSPLWYKKILDGNDKPTGKTAITNDWEDASMYDAGDAAPTFFGAITNNIEYRNWDFSMMMYYSVGNYAYNNIKGMVNSDGAQPLFNLEKEVANSWREPGRNSENPMYVTNDASRAWWRSTRFLQRSDFLKIKNLTLGYTFKKEKLERYNIKNLRLFLMGENLYTLTDFTGYDPELSLNGDTNGNIVPPMTSITFGIDISF